jgi:hypothetical protein
MGGPVVTAPARYPHRIDADKDCAAAADPAADWWTMEDIAAFLQVKIASVRRYRARPRDRGGLPPDDRMFGRTPVWKPQTITRWHENERRGQGWRASPAAQADSREQLRGGRRTPP